MEQFIPDTTIVGTVRPSPGACPSTRQISAPVRGDFNLFYLQYPWYRIATPGAPRLTMLENEYVLEVSPATHRVLMDLLATRSVLRYRDREYLIYELVR